jgi:hypothetical protein
MHNFVRKVDVVHEDKSDSDTISAHRRKGHVYHAPPPPRHTPPTVIAYDWGCKYCGHENDLTNNPYAVNCAQCYQPRVHDTFNINRSLVEKKKSLMMDKEIKESILLSSDAEYAAIQWGISDRSTTLRETKWLIEALDSLSKNILEVYFDTKQMTIQEEEQKAYEERLSYVLQIFQPILSIMKCFSSMIKKDENTLAEKVCQNWSVERDEISRKQYYTYTGGNGRERFRYIGWYEFFDAGSGRLYYSLLGETGWEMTTWKRPHEKKCKISRGTTKRITVVTWKKPLPESNFTQLKMKLLEDRLNAFELAMEALHARTRRQVLLPQFYAFKDVIAEILKMSISHKLLERGIEEHAAHLKKEIIQQILSMPRVKQSTIDTAPESEDIKVLVESPIPLELQQQNMK